MLDEQWMEMRKRMHERNVPALFAGASQPCFLFETRLKGVDTPVENLVNRTGASSPRDRVFRRVVASLALANEFVTQKTRLEAVAVELETFGILALARNERQRDV
jgi:hypothetical protein